MKPIIIIIIFTIIVFVAVVVAAVKMAVKKEKNIYDNGLEADSVVVKCEQYFNSNHDSRHRCYVQYVGNDGLEHEGLLNLQTDLPIGRKVRVRYLPGKYDEVVFISQEI